MPIFDIAPGSVRQRRQLHKLILGTAMDISRQVSMRSQLQVMMWIGRIDSLGFRAETLYRLRIASTTATAGLFASLASRLPAAGVAFWAL